MEYIYFNQSGDISTLNGGSLKLVDKFTNLRSSISSTENNINMQLAMAWTTINRLLGIWKSDLSDKIKHNFFQAGVVSIPLYGCTTWILTKYIDKNLDGICTRIFRAILKKSWKQHPIKQQLYGHLPPVWKTIQIKQRHVRYNLRSNDELISDVPWWTFHMDAQVWDHQLELIYNSSLRTQDVVWKTCQKQWMIELDGEREREKRKSVRVALHDDDDDMYIYTNI